MDISQEKLQLVIEGFVTVKEAKEYLRLSCPTIYKLMEQGKLPHVKFGRARRIPKAALYTFAADSLGQAGVPSSPIPKAFDCQQA